MWLPGVRARGGASITASALSSKTSPLGWRLVFSRAFPLVGFVFGSCPTKARLVESHDGTLGFHHSSIRSVAGRTMIHRSTSPPRAGRPGAQSDRRSRLGRNHRATRATGHVNELRIVVARAQHPEQTDHQAAGDGDFRHPAIPPGSSSVDKCGAIPDRSRAAVCAASISSQRIIVFPCLLIEPSLWRPPLECSRGFSPH